MTVKEEITRTLESLSEVDLRHVADYLAFLRFREWRALSSMVDTEQIAALYAECADEDRHLAEQGMAAFCEGLVAEDRR